MHDVIRTTALIMLAMILISAIAGGLGRAGIPIWQIGFENWAGRATLLHAALMIGGFLGTVIGLERAVALKMAPSFLAPLASSTGGLALLFGHQALGSVLLLLASLIFVYVNVAIFLRQRASHTGLLIVAAVAWLIGNALTLGDTQDFAIVVWWLTFLVTTITAERLEMSRLLRHPILVQTLLLVIVAALICGATLSSFLPEVGGLVFGGTLILLALWLGMFDLARQTVRVAGLSRYMAVCLLTGYVWLAVSGIAWMGVATGCPARDVALHALGLGFVFSMIMGHAPVILPAILRVRLAFAPYFYGPVVLLHGSLLVRLGPGSVDSGLRTLGASLNALSIVTFAATMAIAASIWKHRERHRRRLNEWPLVPLTRSPRQRIDELPCNVR